MGLIPDGLLRVPGVRGGVILLGTQIVNSEQCFRYGFLCQLYQSRVMSEEQYLRVAR